MKELSDKLLELCEEIDDDATREFACRITEIRKEDLQVAYKKMLGLLIGFVVVASVVSVILFVEINRNSQARDALCVFRGNLNRQIEEGESFLAAHPNGAFGFSAKVIRANLDQQKLDSKSLRSLSC